LSNHNPANRDKAQMCFLSYPNDRNSSILGVFLVRFTPDTRNLKVQLKMGEKKESKPIEGQPLMPELSDSADPNFDVK